MSTKYFFAFLFIFSLSKGNAQNQQIKTAKGVLTAIPYAPNVVKLSWVPTAYANNENITAAVIAKPVLQKSIAVSYSNDVIYAGNERKLAIREVVNKNGYNGFSFLLGDGERIFGGGERALPLNRRGYKFPLYNNPWYGYSNGADALNFSVPFFTSSKGYGLFFDNASKGYADIGKTIDNEMEFGFVSGELNVYIIFGSDYKEILSSYYKLTGTQPLPPRWAMGNFMSRFGYTSEAQVEDIAAKMKKEKIPFDAVIFDLFWFGDSIKGTLGNLDWVNKTKWPDPKKMMGDFKKDNINSILIAEPFILKGTKNYDAAKQFMAVDSANKPFNLTDFYFGYGGLLDIFRKDAGSWIWNNHYKRQLANGAAGWWTDLGEPEKHPDGIWHNLKDLGVKRLMKADEVHNIYGHYWNKMLFENYAKDLPNSRLFHLNRSGFAGSQRYSIFPWSGDVSRSWSGLQAQLPVMLGMSMSGIPYIHADAGGFAGGEGDKELYVRWLQFATFTPIFRPHGTALFEVDKQAYSFPSEPALIDSPYRNYVRQTINLRYSMMPYNYTLAYKQAANGEPLVTPLYYYYPKDTAAINVSDEFMWGENILVAPVLEKGIKQRKIYLPEGKWYPYYDIVTSEGSRNIGVGMEAIPFYVKAGSFIPTNQDSKFTEDTTLSKAAKSNAFTITYYYDTKPSSGVAYFDDGNSKTSINSRQYELFTFDAAPLSENEGLRIVIKSNNGNYTGKPAKRWIELVLKGFNRNNKSLYLNGKKLESFKSEVGYNPKYEFGFTFTGKPVTLEFK